MTASIDQRAREIFVEITELPAPQRAAALDRACAGDEQLHAEVASLLEHADSPGLSISPVKLDWSLIDLPGEDEGLVGSTIEHFEILEVLASGGMGVVYRARQMQPDRDVALKVLRAGLHSDDAQRRFALEVEILGRLRHPAIAAVYEAGTHRRGGIRLPFFAMELIEHARPLTQYAREENLSPRRRLELIAQVCDAVHHGHQKGVVHRDLKPSNILVDADGRPRIIDFGVARATGGDIAATTMHTTAGSVVGTLQYMSPEQCDGDPCEIDTRSDIYSLGVILYELLCDAPPYDVSTSTIEEAALAIRSASIPPPRSIRRTISRSLEAIVLMALARDRSARYQSAAELGSDIRAHLQGQPVAARAPGPWVRLSRVIGRRPLATTAVACILIAALSLGATTLAIWWLNMQPFSVALSPDRSEAWIIARNGHVLHRFDGDGPDGVRLVLRVPTGDGAWRAAVGFEGRRSGPYSGRLIVVDPAHPDDPLWTTPIAAAEFDPPHPGVAGPADIFHIQDCSVADVFPELSGEEIIAVFHHFKYSPSALRVYDTDGALLFQVWNDGSIGAHCWMPGWNRLLLMAMHNRVTPEDIGEAEFPLYSHPLVLITVKPESGAVHSTWIASGDTSAQSRAGLFKVLVPAALWKSIGNYGVRSSAEFPGEASIDYRYLLGREPTAVSIAIDRNGEVLDRLNNIGYEGDGGPDVETFRFVDLHGFDPNARDREY